MHIVEDAMIREVMKNGGPTPAINARIAGYVQAAERAGCAIFMTACSSIGASVESCQFLSSIPLTRIDEAMVEAAIAQGPRIAVLATVETTLKPTLEFISRKALACGRRIEVLPNLMAPAFTALLAGDHATHDQIVSAGLRAAVCDGRRRGPGPGFDGAGSRGHGKAGRAGSDLARERHDPPQGKARQRRVTRR